MDLVTSTPCSLLPSDAAGLSRAQCKLYLHWDYSWIAACLPWEAAGPCCFLTLAYVLTTSGSHSCCLKDKKEDDHGWQPSSPSQTGGAVGPCKSLQLSR